MDEYLSEKEQIELIRQWWRENRWYLFSGVAIVAIGYFGVGQYRSYQVREAEAAASLYQVLALNLEDDDRAGADSVLATLESEHAGSAYLDQARLLIAEANLVRDTDRAINEIAAVVAESDDPGMVMIARLRLARVLAWDEQYDRALDVLNVDDPGEFGARFSEVRGDILAARGENAAAIDAYTEALLGASNGTINREFLQLKLNDLLQALEPESGDEG